MTKVKKKWREIQNSSEGKFELVEVVEYGLIVTTKLRGHKKIKGDLKEILRKRREKVEPQAKKVQKMTPDGKKTTIDIRTFLTKVTPNSKEENELKMVTKNVKLNLLDKKLTASPLKRNFEETLTENVDSDCDEEKRKRRRGENEKVIRPCQEIEMSNENGPKYLPKGTSPLRKLLLKKNKKKENEKKTWEF